LNLELMTQLKESLQALDKDDDVRCMIITGNERVFAAGADIKQMAGKGAIDMLKIDQFTTWEAIRRIKKPIIAAVSGYALGGACELTMLCDMIVASETAQFGQPEIKIGVMPGAGGTQRLTRAVGKARAMEMALTGRFITAKEAYDYGLINKIVPVEVYLDEAKKLAKAIAQQSPIAVQLIKESVCNADENHLQEGLLLERKNFYMLFATEDQTEGMNAFVEKRRPDFKGK
ncbi:MAG: enoyl-CoA hydratase/isomerase family protein, partial [Bacteroidetes bacterium]|nr:enoyl-CoA hydratase/isomerase family protein [Bacteroidota bacterium]